MAFAKRMIDIEEIRSATGFSLSYLRALTRAGKLKGELRGRKYWYDAGQVNAYLNTKLQVREKEVESLSDL